MDKETFEVIRQLLGAAIDIQGTQIEVLRLLDRMVPEIERGQLEKALQSAKTAEQSLAAVTEVLESFRSA